MIRKIQRQWFEVWGQAEAQNRILKLMLAVLGTTIIPLTAAVTVLSLRNPPTILIDPTTSLLISPSVPDAKSLEREISRALLRYLQYRHTWTADNIETATRFAAMNFVAAGFREKFLIGAQEEIRIAKEKRLSQKIFPENPDVSSADEKATARAERILIINGIRAAQSLTLELQYTSGARTVQNPEGIYVTDEKLINH